MERSTAFERRMIFGTRMQIILHEYKQVSQWASHIYLETTNNVWTFKLNEKCRLANLKQDSVLHEQAVNHLII